MGEEKEGVSGRGCGNSGLGGGRKGNRKRMSNGERMLTVRKGWGGKRQWQEGGRERNGERRERKRKGSIKEDGREERDRGSDTGDRRRV